MNRSLGRLDPRLRAEHVRLGLTPQVFEPCARDMAKRAELRKTIRKRFHELALECHPDRAPERAEEFKQLAAAHEDIEQFLEHYQPPPPMAMPMVPMFVTFNNGTTTSSTTTSSFGFGGVHFVFVRHG